MRERGYYSVRTGVNPNGARIDLRTLKRLFLASYNQLEDEGYFQEAFGYNCTDAGDVAGTLGLNIEAHTILELRKENVWPISRNIDSYKEDDLFDVIEFLFDTVSKPIEGYFHSWNDCGMHYSSFNKAEGRERYQKVINPLLAIYGNGFTLSEDGEMLTTPEQGMAQLLEADLPKLDPTNIEGRVRAATILFRKQKSSLEDRKHALRDLADVLEYLKPQMQSILTSKDESDLFNIANNFGVRHHNDKQKTNYDTAVWCSWMFYFYLSTIHACVHTLEKKNKVAQNMDWPQT